MRPAPKSGAEAASEECQSTRPQVAAMRGVTLPFTEPRYDMINPVVHREGSQP